MDTLSDHNKQAYQNQHKEKQQVHPAGVACDKCGTEMLYSNPDCTLASIPPKKTVYCPECGYIGYKVVT